MATVTLDAQPVGRSVSGPNRIRRGTINLGTYHTDGATITAADFELYVALDDLRVDANTGYVADWDQVNSTILVYVQTDPADTGGADVPLVELADNGNLTAIEFRFEAVGR